MMQPSKSLLVGLLTLVGGWIVVGSLSAVSAETETISFTFNPNVDPKKTLWTPGFNQSDQNFSNTEFVPKGETVENWTQMLNVQSFAKSGFPEPEKAMATLRERMLQRCPNAVWKIIEKIKKDVLYEWRIENCPGNADQHEVARLFDGKWNRFRLAYVEKTKELAPEVRDYWIQVLREGKTVIKNE